jgi:hypothetical protein
MKGHILSSLYFKKAYFILNKQSIFKISKLYFKPTTRGLLEELQEKQQGEP